jgi:hypothetical protein
MKYYLLAKRAIPSQWEAHSRPVRALIRNKRNADDCAELILEKVSNVLEPAGIAGPSTRTGDAARELCALVSVGHASRYLELREQLFSMLSCCLIGERREVRASVIESSERTR